MKLFLWLLQIVAEMVRNLVMASWLTYTVSRSWLGIFHIGRCGVIQDVRYGSRMKERGWQRNNCRSAKRGYW